MPFSVFPVTPVVQKVLIISVNPLPPATSIPVCDATSVALTRSTKTFERAMTGSGYQPLNQLAKAGHRSGERAKGLPAHPLRL